MVSRSWIKEYYEIIKIKVADIGTNFPNWRREMTLCGQALAELNINREISQRYSLSPLLSALCMIPLTLVLRGPKTGFKWEA